MCKTHNPRKIDKCMKDWTMRMDAILKDGFKLVGTCCGHNRYPMSVIIKAPWGTFDLISGKIIKRKKRFYKKDSKGYYYIPEVVKGE